jgi:hypothetical protein
MCLLGQTKPDADSTVDDHSQGHTPYSNLPLMFDSQLYRAWPTPQESCGSLGLGGDSADVILKMDYPMNSIFKRAGGVRIRRGVHELSAAGPPQLADGPLCDLAVASPSLRAHEMGHAETGYGTILRRIG